MHEVRGLPRFQLSVMLIAEMDASKPQAFEVLGQFCMIPLIAKMDLTHRCHHRPSSRPRGPLGLMTFRFNAEDLVFVSGTEREKFTAMTTRLSLVGGNKPYVLTPTQITRGQH